MLNSSSIQSRRPLARTLAVGVPWLAVVGLLAGAEYIRNEGTFTRGVLQLFSGTCPSQVAGLDLAECAELEAAPGFPLENDPQWLVWAPTEPQHLQILGDLQPDVQNHVGSPIPQLQLERSQEALIALEAARAEVEHAVAVARSTCREAQELRMTSGYLLRRSEAPRPASEAPAVNVRVSTDG